MSHSSLATPGDLSPTSVSYGTDDIPFVAFPDPHYVSPEDIAAIAAALVTLISENTPNEGSPWNTAGRIEAVAQLRSMI
jgi:hypothetical protein